MSDDEIVAFLTEQKTVVCASHGHRGWPHLMPLWFIVRSDSEPTPDIWAWTYGASQKVRNLQRDPRATLQLQSGETYDQLRGVMIEADAVIHRELETVTELGAELAVRYGGGAELGDEARAALAHQARKRVALQFVARRTASWDHTKL